MRGAGPGRHDPKTNGAKPFQSEVSAKPSPLVVVGMSRVSTTGDSTNTKFSIALTADAIKDEYSVKVADPSDLRQGRSCLLDGRPEPRAKIRKGAEKSGRPLTGAVVWQKHNPAVQFVDDFAPEALPTTPQSAGSWFSRLDRPTAEIKEVASVAGSTVTFTTPIIFPIEPVTLPAIPLRAAPRHQCRRGGSDADRR